MAEAEAAETDSERLICFLQQATVDFRVPMVRDRDDARSAARGIPIAGGVNSHASHYTLTGGHPSEHVARWLAHVTFGQASSACPQSVACLHRI